MCLVVSIKSVSSMFDNSKKQKILKRAESCLQGEIKTKLEARYTEAILQMLKFTIILDSLRDQSCTC